MALRERKVFCNQCYTELTGRELSVYSLQWQYSGDMYCLKCRGEAEMSDRGRKLYRVRVIFEPDYHWRRTRANSEEEAIEQFKEEHEHEIVHNWIKYIAEEVEDEE